MQRHWQMFPISPVAETAISAPEKPQQTSLNTTGRFDKLPETRDFYAKREFSGASVDLVVNTVSISLV